VRKKYAKFEGSLRGVDSRILTAQVPGGMLTNMESQLREQGAEERFDEVLAEIPRVRKDLGFIPLVTPTSQIVGTQSVINVLAGERYKSVTKETEGVLKGEYGSTPAPMNADLQARILGGGKAITCRPADNIMPELDSLVTEYKALAVEKSIDQPEGSDIIDDVLTYALFPQIGLKFLENRNNPDAFEAVPTGTESSAITNDAGEEVYTVSVEGQSYTVTVDDGGDLTGVSLIGAATTDLAGVIPAAGGDPVPAPLAGNIFKVLVTPGQQVSEGDTVLILEAMKMETEISAPKSGVVADVNVGEGDSVAVGDVLLTIA
jgi:oxaloacetate decarboxylase alpha subunit